MRNPLFPSGVLENRYFTEIVTKNSVSQVMRSLGCRAIYVDIRNEVMKPLLAGRGQREKITIWSAPCGTGLELNDIHEMVRQVSGVIQSKPKEVSLIGTDKDKDFVEIAKQRFQSDEFASVSFEEGDIIDPSYSSRFSPDSIDIIFFLGITNNRDPELHEQTKFAETFWSILKGKGLLITDQWFFREFNFNFFGLLSEPIIDDRLPLFINSVGGSEDAIPHNHYFLFLKSKITGSRNDVFI